MLDRFRIAFAAFVVSGALMAGGAGWLLEQMERQIVASVDEPATTVRIPQAGRFEVRVVAPADVDRTAVNAVREVFQTVVPLAALLIGVLVWLALTTSDTFVRLNDALERQRRFTSDASHELRTPLASARTQLEVLLAHPDRVDWRRTAENTVLDLDRMQAVVTDLLFLARLEGPVAAGRVDLAALVGVPGPVEVMGDRAHLERIVRNLLDNAERHASSRVEVTVTVESGGTAVLRVADDGPGIPEADRERVFERFVRLDEGRARDDGGAGLGLAIVREGVLAHGGTVGIEDSDQGTVVAVRLPLA
ncbi:sensor histidine kinase [Saccharothrix deserti]|uniref:sensor histidine kinase n=1 Tax=Saccharothrix deserti TaxID=2593674 RepID=UPI001EE3A79E|nr:HAMP domain-containing sensor histidine kinase [Saccharothrix deserti]